MWTPQYFAKQTLKVVPIMLNNLYWADSHLSLPQDATVGYDDWTIC